MNELGMWIKQNTTRKNFAAELGVSLQSVSHMCGIYGVNCKHIDAVSKMTGIPRARLHGVAIKGGEQAVKLTFNGAYWTGG